MRLSVGASALGGLTSGSQAAMAAALGVVAENVLADCADYVPYDLGALRESGRASASGGKATVSWGTDAGTARYARVQYYGAGLSHKTTQNLENAPKATHHWFEAARAEREDAWQEMARREYTRRL